VRRTTQLLVPVLTGVLALVLVALLLPDVPVPRRRTPSVVPGAPHAYADHVARAARGCDGLPARVLAAQLETESRWDPRAVSPAGAVGLAQFMPATWAEYGVDADRDGSADPRDPVDAIHAAARYDCALRTAVAGLPGDEVTLVLAAYNAGPSAVLDAGGVPAIAETREYVRRVLARVAQHRRAEAART
jgi:soluble lytic murein transglycosylase-like protein